MIKDETTAYKIGFSVALDIASMYDQEVHKWQFPYTAERARLIRSFRSGYKLGRIRLKETILDQKWIKT